MEYFFSLNVDIITEQLFIFIDTLSCLNTYSIEKVYIVDPFDLYSPNNSP